MGRFKEFWNSGNTGRGVLIGIVVAIVVIGACLVLVLSGLGLTRVMGTLFPTAVPAGLGTAEITGTPNLTQTGIPASTVTDTPQPAFTPTRRLSTPTRTPVLPTATPRRNPTPTATTAPGYTITFLTSPILVGQNVTLTIQTVPNSSCNLTYITPLGMTSNAPGLGQTTSTAKGVCSWTWKITQNTKPGTGKLYITAGGITGEKNITIQ